MEVFGHSHSGTVVLFKNMHVFDLFQDCLRHDPDSRPTCSQLLKHEFFTRDGFSQKFAHDIKAKISREHQNNPLINSLSHEKEDDDSNKQTTTKKKKKLVPVKKESKVDADSKDSKHNVGTKPKEKEVSQEKKK